MKGRGVRIAGGTLRGRTVAVPKGVRPTEGRVREAFFDIVGDRLAGCRFLDLFAGSGAVGLEAWSRGATSVLQIDGAAVVVRHLVATGRNLGTTAVEPRRLELPRGLSRLAGAPGSEFDLAFVDPPYAFTEHDELLAGIARLIAPDGLVALEHDARASPVESAGTLSLEDRRRYGDCALSFYASSAARGSGGVAETR